MIIKYKTMENQFICQNCGKEFKRQSDLSRHINKNNCKQNLIQIPYKCEKCGKEVTELYGSGRFCSRACANARNHSEETKRKIQIGVLKDYQKRNIGKIIYKNNPKFCIICGKKIDYTRRKFKTCGNDDCVKLLHSQITKSIVTKDPNKYGGLRYGSGRGKKGWYKGYYCDSTYELVWIIYNLDHNIEFKRFTSFYEYEYKGKIHKYYPDFLMPDGSLVEIKGYYNDIVDIKCNAVTDRNINVLYKSDLKYAFDYVKNNYSYKKLQDLYE